MDNFVDKIVLKLEYNPYLNNFTCCVCGGFSASFDQDAFNNKLDLSTSGCSTLLKGIEVVFSIIESEFSPKCREIEIGFSGTRSDYMEFKSFFQYYKSIKKSKISHIVINSVWPKPRDVYLKLDQIKERLLLLFNDMPEIGKELAKYNQIKPNVVNLFVAGVQNVGKSTFINTFIGYNILPTSQRVETATNYIIKETKRFAVTYYYKGSPYSIAFREEGVTRHSKKHDNKALLTELDSIIAAYHQTPHQKIAQLALALNKYCRIDLEEKTSNENPFFGKVIIELPHFNVTARPEKSRMRFVVIDSPGAFAQVEGASHDKILEDSLEDTVNSIAVVITNKVALSHITNRQLMDKIAEKSGGQIDLAQSLYIINQAEGLDKPQIAEQVDVIQHDPFLSDRYVMFTSAQVANDAKLGNKIEQAYTVKFDNRLEDSIQLYKYSGLPKNHQANFEVGFDDILQNCEDLTTRVLINTGFPMIEQAIVYSGLRYSQLRNVKSTVAIIGNIINKIRNINETNKQEFTFLQQTTSSALEQNITHLQAICDKSLNKIMAEIKDIKYRNKEEQAKITDRFMDTIDCCGKTEFDAGWPEFMKNLIDEKASQLEIKNAVTNRCKEFTSSFKPQLRKTVSEIVDEYLDRFKTDFMENVNQVNQQDGHYLVESIAELLTSTESIVSVSDFSARPQMLESEKKGIINQTLSILKGNIYKQYAQRAESFFDAYIEKSIIEPHFVNVIDTLISKTNKITDEMQKQLTRLSPSSSSIENNLSDLEEKINFIANCEELIEKIELYIKSLKVNETNEDFSFV